MNGLAHWVQLILSSFLVAVLIVVPPLLGPSVYPLVLIAIIFSCVACLAVSAVRETPFSKRLFLGAMAAVFAVLLTGIFSPGDPMSWVFASFGLVFGGLLVTILADPWGYFVPSKRLIGEGGTGSLAAKP